MTKFTDGLNSENLSSEQRRQLQRMRRLEGWVILRRGCFLTAAAITLLICYALSQFRGLDQPQAMEQAQIGRNLARGEGFTTRFIRPLSIWQLSQSSKKHKLSERHPDLMNPPAYPALVAALFSVTQKGSLVPAEKVSSETGGGPRFAAGLRWPPWWMVWLGGACLFLAILLGWRRVWSQPGCTRLSVSGAVVCLFVAALFLVPATSFQVEPRKIFTLFGPDRLLVFGLGLPLTLLNGLLAYLIARRLFNRRVAVLAACLFALSDTVCQYAISGLSVPLTMAWVSAAWLAMVAAHQRPAQNKDSRVISWQALAAAALIGGAFLTQYSAGWLLVPALVFACWTGGVWRGPPLMLCMLSVFAVVAMPWLVRNLWISDDCFGLATCQILEQTAMFPGHTLERMLGIAVGSVPLSMLAGKAASNASAFWSDSPWLLGCGFALMGFVGALFHTFPKPEANFSKWLAASAAALLFLVTCVVGREARPEGSAVQTGDLCVLLLPVVAVYGAAMLDQWVNGLLAELSSRRSHRGPMFCFLTWVNSLLAKFSNGHSFQASMFRFLMKLLPINDRSLRGFLVICVALLAGLPMLTRVVVPKKCSMAYPPYHPPVLSEASAYLKPEELVVSDQPWAVAWYGDRKCVWIPHDLRQFFQINDQHQHIAALLLSPVTLNNRFLTEIMTPEWQPWSPVLGFMVFPRDFFLISGTLFVGPDLTPIPWEKSKPVDTTAIVQGLNFLLFCDHKRVSQAVVPPLPLTVQSPTVSP